MGTGCIVVNYFPNGDVALAFPSPPLKYRWKERYTRHFPCDKMQITEVGFAALVLRTTWQLGGDWRARVMLS